MPRTQSVIRFQPRETSVRSPARLNRLRAVTREAAELDDDARFAEIEDIYLSGMMRGMTRTPGTRH